MRSWVLGTAAVIAVVAWGSGTAYAGKVEIKGAHICCGMCQGAIGKTLKGVDGVSDASCMKGGSITFTTKDDKTTQAAIAALADAGFTGAATDDGKEVKTDLPSPKAGEKADSVTVTGTHVCCGMCKGAIKKLFPDAKSVDFGDDKTSVTISGKDLEKAAVLKTMRDAGFNGTIK
jgi:hypothetical protein